MAGISNSFTNQEPRIATKEEIASWKENTMHGLRCYLCGEFILVGHVWRWVYGSKSKGLINFKVCEPCDGEDVQHRWEQKNKILMKEFFWAAAY